MKKNILTVVILALSVINLVLIAVLMFSVVPMANKTNALISQVASIIDLELESPDAGQKINLSKVEPKEINPEGGLTINLTDGANSYALLDGITLSINTEHEDYKELNPTIDKNISFILQDVNDIIKQHTKEEMKSTTETEKVRQEILEKIQDRFGSQFICDIALNNLRCQ